MSRVLSRAEILKLAGQAGVKKAAVENFLGTCDPVHSKQVHMMNLSMDVHLYRWNAKTVGAIRRVATPQRAGGRSK